VRRAVGLLTRGALRAAFPAVGQWRSARSFSPHSGGTVPDSHRVPLPLAGLRAEPIIERVARFQSVWLPVIACATLIFVLSGIPSLGTGLGTWDLVGRTVAHAAIYAVLGALLLRALERGLASVAGGIAYAVSDEIHQHFVPGRSSSALDVAIDALGVVAGVAIMHRLRG
jgi:hypothetical protein